MDGSSGNLITEDEATRVLERAAEIEARQGGSVDVEQLRQAAMDVGIPPHAFERALADVRAGLEVHDGAEEPSSGRSPARFGTALRRAALTGLGMALGVFCFVLAAINGLGLDAAAIFVMTIAVFVAIALMTVDREDRPVLGFEADLAALWTGLTLIGLIGNPADAGEILAAMMAGGAAVGAVGAVVVALRGRSEEPSLPPADGRTGDRGLPDPS